MDIDTHSLTRCGRGLQFTPSIHTVHSHRSFTPFIHTIHTHRYDGSLGPTVVPIFINEAAYYYAASGLGIMLTQAVEWPVPADLG